MSYVRCVYEHWLNLYIIFQASPGWEQSVPRPRAPYVRTMDSLKGWLLRRTSWDISISSYQYYNIWSDKKDPLSTHFAEIPIPSLDYLFSLIRHDYTYILPSHLHVTSIYTLSQNSTLINTGICTSKLLYVGWFYGNISQFRLGHIPTLWLLIPNSELGKIHPHT
jgi:hypothetical protein